MIALALLVASGHDGIIRHRSAPELSDIALFVMAALGVWFARRALRRRFAAKADAEPTRED